MMSGTVFLSRAAILGSRLIQEQTGSLKEMVEQYMEITDIAIRDIVPKYIMHSLVHSLQVGRSFCTCEADPSTFSLNQPLGRFSL